MSDSELQKFLAASKKAAQNLDDYTSVTVVIGNESCDLDSIVSAVVYGYHLQQKLKDDVSIVIPLLQCSEQGFQLRGGAVLLFDQLGLDAATLSYVDSVDLSPALASGRLSVVLVDANVLSSKLARFHDQVREIVDHHKDEHIAYHPDCERLIEPVGCCATLVAERILSENEDIVDDVVAHLLLAAVLLDTYNLSDEAKRATDKDRLVVEKLTTIATISSEELYRSVLAAACDNSSYSGRQLLEKDYKQAKGGDINVGFSSILGKLSELVGDAGFVTDVAQFASDRGVDLLVLLGVDVEEAVLRGRSIGLYRPPGGRGDEELVSSVASMLTASSEVGASPEQSADPLLILLKQNNTKASRKFILPAIMEFVSGDTVAVDPSASLFVNIKAPPVTESVTLDSYVHVEQMEERPGDPPGKDIDPPPPLEPVVKIVTGPSVESDVDLSEDVSVSYEAPDKLRRKVMEPNEGSPPAGPIKEYSMEEEQKETRRYRTVTAGDSKVKIDLQEIEPYRKIIQHMGYKGTTAIVIVSAYHLPPRSLPNHAHMLTQVFYYVISTLDRLVVDDYIIIYFHSVAPRRSMPGFVWLRRFYQMVDRRLRKNLIQLLVVHPSVWIKTMLMLARPFISSKFYRKVHMLPMIEDIQQYLKVDDSYIPQPVIEHNKVLFSRQQRYVIPEASKTDVPESSHNDQLPANEKPSE